jgi:glyoxylase-like metal-dependent hydrolase (beta-lactamase superfamily II)
MKSGHTTSSISVVDAHYLSPGRMSIYLLIENGRAVFVDNNTVHAVPRMMDALAAAGLSPEAVDYAIVTHVHLDHAGGTAALLEQCPNARALVHPKTFRHLANPARLVEASRQIYGDQFDSIYGTIQPVPEDRMRIIADGERIDWQGHTFTCFYTLGHASHHFCVHDSASAAVFTGDSFGIAYPELQCGSKPYIFAAATPTEFDPVEARKAVHRILSFEPERVCLGHYGCFEQVSEMAERLLYTIEQTELVINQAARMDTDEKGLSAWIHAETLAMTKAALEQSGLPLNGEVMKWVNPDIMLNAQGLLAAGKRLRRKMERGQ